LQQSSLGVMETIKQSSVPRELLDGLLPREDQTAPTDLPSLPTAITSQRDRPSNQEGRGGAGSPVTTQPRVTSVSSDGVKTLPQPIKAPAIDLTPPTVPMMLARLPTEKVKSLASRAEVQPTIETRARSAQTLDMRGTESRWYLWLLLAFALVLMLVAGYV